MPKAPELHFKFNPIIESSRHFALIFVFITSIALFASAALLRLPPFPAVASTHHHVEVIPIPIVSSDSQQQ
jgi:hypothetical protein